MAARVCPADLTKKTCVPCEGGTPPMGPQDVAEYLKVLSGWQAEENKKIKKEFVFKDFPSAIAFVNRVAAVAESERHHPALFISYNKVRVTLSTHAIGGLSENDFIVAAKTDELLRS